MTFGEKDFYVLKKVYIIHSQQNINFILKRQITGLEGFLSLSDFGFSLLSSFLGMKDCSLNLLLSSSMTWYLLHMFVSLLVSKKVKWTKDFQRSVFMAQHRCQPEKEGAASLLLKQRLQWGAAKQAGLRDNGKDLGGQAEHLQIKKPKTWLRLKWFSNFTDIENYEGNAISLLFLFCMIQ